MTARRPHESHGSSRTKITVGDAYTAKKSNKNTGQHTNLPRRQDPKFCLLSIQHPDAAASCKQGWKSACTPRYRGQEPCRFAGVPGLCSVFVAGSGRDPRAQQPSPLPYTVLLPTQPVTLSRKAVIARNSLRGVICSATACLGRRYASLQPLLTSILCRQMRRGKGGFLTECRLPETPFV